MAISYQSFLLSPIFLSIPSELLHCSLITSLANSQDSTHFCSCCLFLFIPNVPRNILWTHSHLYVLSPVFLHVSSECLSLWREVIYALILTLYFYWRDRRSVVLPLKRSVVTLSQWLSLLVLILPCNIQSIISVHSIFPRWHITSWSIKWPKVETLFFPLEMLVCKPRVLFCSRCCQHPFFKSTTCKLSWYPFLTWYFILSIFWCYAFSSVSEILMLTFVINALNFITYSVWLLNNIWNAAVNEAYYISCASFSKLH